MHSKKNKEQVAQAFFEMDNWSWQRDVRKTLSVDFEIYVFYIP